MGQPITATVQLAAADDDGISLSQTPLAGGNLTITGALASGGVATLTSAGAVRQVIITCAGNETSRTFTIYGTDATGLTISEALAGASGGIASAVRFYRTVTRIAVDAATADAVKAGTNGVGSSFIVNPDMFMAPFAIGVGTVLNSGSANWTVQHTFDNIYNSNASGASLTWFANSGITGKSANTDGNYAFPVQGIRLLINSGTGSVTMTVIQATTSP